MKQKQSVIFITGGSRGIGKAIVEKFHSHHWLTAACATTEKSAKASGADLSLVCDVSHPNEVKLAIEQIMKKFNRLDALVNNAGIAGGNSLNPDDNDEFWHRIIEVNLHGTYYASKYALPHLPDHTGRIVNISSVLGLKGVPDQIAYCAAKHGVLGFTKALSHHVASRGITVNAVCPGWVRTDMMLGRMRELHATEEALASHVPLGKIIAPKEIADVVYYLIASETSGSITGQSIVVDGGVLA